MDELLYNSIFIGIIIVIIIIIIYEIIIHICVHEIEMINTNSFEDIKDNSIIPHIIPRIIHRTWYSRSLTKKMHDAAYLTWINLNPGYKMIWNNDNDCEQFMKNYGADEYNAWKRIIPTAYKADLWRLCALFESGGVYIDSYAVAVRSIDEIILKSGLKDEKDIFISVLDCEQSGAAVHNGFIICTPKHPIVKQCIKDILINVEKGEEDEVMSLTGPICLSRSINRYVGRDINIKHSVGLNYVNGKKYYLLQFHWGPYGYITLNDEIMLYKKYDFIDCWLYQKVYKCMISSKQDYVGMSRAGTVVSPK